MIYTEKIEQLSNENQTLKAELALFQVRCEQYAQAYDSLKAQIIELRRHRFGKRSERYIDVRHEVAGRGYLPLWKEDHLYHEMILGL